MLLAGFVVFRRPPHQPFGQCLAPQRRIHLPRRHLFNQIEQSAPVAIGHIEQRRARLAIKRQIAADLRLGPRDHLLQFATR